MPPARALSLGAPCAFADSTGRCAISHYTLIFVVHSQLFILLTAGFAAGRPRQEPPELQGMGGFSSSQVKTIYDHLDNAVLEQAREKLMQQFTPATLALKKLAEGNSEHEATSR